jgi:large subunit ribosomal protein L29|tara:strand:+ start:350 stop:535 length:186 start_codon:yes stop_codon:yes gene_type:complete
MKKEEIKKFSTDELKNKINSFKKDLFNLRFRKINGQLEDSSKVSEIKRNVAKLLTTLNNKK